MKNNNDAKAIVIAAIITAFATICAACITGGFMLQAAWNQSQLQVPKTEIVDESSLKTPNIISATPTRTLFFTTPSPSRTPLAPTETATSPLLEPNGTIFNDDFESGIKADWDVIYGNLGMANGKYTVTSPFDNRQTKHLAILQGYNWGNIRVRVTLLDFWSSWMCDFPCDASPAAGIVLRYQVDAPSVGLIILPDTEGVAFGTIGVNGIWTIQAGSQVTGEIGGFNFRDAPTEITVEARGDSYFVFVDNRKVTSASIPGATNGEVGLWFQTSRYSDGLEQYAPRFDSFEIEAIP